MENKKYFFAVDLGATSGRTIIGNIADGKFELEEVTRFPNNLIEQGGHYYWDIYALYFEIIKGLKEVAQRGLEITSIGIHRRRRCHPEKPTRLSRSHHLRRHGRLPAPRCFEA